MLILEILYAIYAIILMLYRISWASLFPCKVLRLCQLIKFASSLQDSYVIIKKSPRQSRAYYQNLPKKNIVFGIYSTFLHLDQWKWIMWLKFGKIMQ